MNDEELLFDHLGGPVNILEAFPEGALLVDGETGIIVYANDGAAELLGYTREKLARLTVEDLIPPSLESAHAALRAKFLGDAGPRVMAPSRQVRARRQDGTELSLVISIGEVPSSNGTLVLAVLRNVTATIAYEQSMAHVLKSLDFIEIGLLVLSADPLVIVHANEAARRITGYSLEDLLDQPLGELGIAFPDESRLYQQGVSKPRDPRKVSEQVLLRQDGLLVPVEVEFAKLSPGTSEDSGVLMIFRDLHARRKVETLRRTNKLREIEAQRLLAISRERDRIAQDFHDTVIQEIFGTGLDLQAAAVASDGAVKERLERSIAALDDVISAIRRAIFDLQEPRADEDEVRVRFLQVVDWAERLLGFSCEVRFEGTTAQIDPECEQDLLAVLREALSNVSKHSGASAVSISLSVDSTVQLTVSDDGRGFNLVGSSPRGDEFGLANMAARAERLGGVFDLEPGQDGGTVLRWEVPVDSPSQPSLGL